MPTYECDQCGACCGTFPIFASADDAVREPRVAAETRELPDHLSTTAWRFQLFPLPFHQACCFLGADRRCEIYPTRPTTCGDFAAGSEQCQEARRRHGLPRLRERS
jgi:Fe-S-cluster containining protein